MAQALDQLVFYPDDDEAFEVAANGLVDKFEAWLADQHLDPDDGWIAHQLLHAKWAFIDGALARWTSADLEEILLDVFPRKVVVEDDEMPDIVPTVMRFFEFLDSCGMLDPSGDDSQALRGELRRLQPMVAEALCDPSRFDLDKTLFVAMANDGVNLNDLEAVSDWINAFNAKQGAQMLRAATPSAAPVDLPDELTLAKAAETTPLVRQLAAFVEWIGKGRKLTQAGNLRLADGKALVDVLGTNDVIDPRTGDRTFAIRSATELGGVDLVFRIALQARLARRHRGQVVTTRRGRQVVGDPLETWRAAAAAWLDLGILGWWDGQWRPWYYEPLDTGIEELLGALYTAGSIELAELSAAALDGMSHLYDLDGLPEIQRRLLPEGLTHGIEGVVVRLEWLGMLTWREAEVVERVGGHARCGGDVALTPLGCWYARALLADLGYDVPLVEDWADADADKLLAEAAHWPMERAEATMRRWARDRADAFQELVAAGGASADIAVRLGVIEGVAAIAEDPEAGVRRLREEATLRSLAALWLLARDLLDLDTLDPAEMLGMFAEKLALVLAQEGPDAVTDAAHDAAELLNGVPVTEVVAEVWRMPSPSTPAVLEALAASDDKALAKAARTARFKLGSAC